MTIRDPYAQFEPYYANKEMRMMTLAAAGDAGSYTPHLAGQAGSPAVVEMVYAMD